MANNSITPHGSLSKQMLWLLAVCVFVFVFAVDWYLCGIECRSQKQDILKNREIDMLSWVNDTVESVSLWTHALESQAKRVSSSELYRLFAEDMNKLGPNAVGILEDASPTKGDAEGISALAEQMPMMRNLLLDFMNFNGFSDSRIVNAKGETLLCATSQPVPLSNEQKSLVASATKENKLLFGAVRTTEKGLVLDFADPLRQVLEGEDTGNAVAALLLSVPVTSQIVRFMARDLRHSSDAEPLLVQKSGEGYTLISAQADKTVSAENSKQINAETLPFGLRQSFKGNDMAYSCGKSVPLLPWYVVLETPEIVVADELRSLAFKTYGIGALVGIATVLFLSLLWWISIGRQAKMNAEHFKLLYAQIGQQKQLLDSINKSMDMGLAMIGADGKVAVCNTKFETIVGKKESSVSGENLTTLFASKEYVSLLEGIQNVVSTNAQKALEIKPLVFGEERLYRVTLFPFVNYNAKTATPEGAVAIFQDITKFRKESKQRKQRMEKAIEALVRAIETVDPYLKGHSQRMQGLAILVAKKMQLDTRDQETISMAANLSQMGKMFIPHELLAKTGQLTPEEQAIVMQAPQLAYNILRDIGSDLPVADAVHEMSERMDGEGYPQHLQGNEISIHARVLAVVNAFCAMTSPRSYRATGMPVQTALARLHEDNAFDPQVIVALEAVLGKPEGVVESPEE